jgi:hypothetical protein
MQYIKNDDFFHFPQAMRIQMVNIWIRDVLYWTYLNRNKSTVPGLNIRHTKVSKSPESVYLCTYALYDVRKAFEIFLNYVLDTH